MYTSLTPPWGHAPAPFLPLGQVLCTRTQLAPTLGRVHPGTSANTNLILKVITRKIK